MVLEQRRDEIGHVEECGCRDAIDRSRLEAEMRGAAKRFEFERAAELRDRIKYLRERELQLA